MAHRRCAIDIWALNQWKDHCVENILWMPTGKSISLNLCWKVEVKVLVTLSCSLPGSSVHGIPQARILEWVAMPSSRGLSWPRDQTWVSHTAGRFFTVWAKREAHVTHTTILNYGNCVHLYLFSIRFINLCLGFAFNSIRFYNENIFTVK